MSFVGYRCYNKSLKGKFKVRKHARDRFKDRHGNEYIGNKKIKNMGKHTLNQKIIKSLKKRREKIIEQRDGSLLVITKDFKAVVMPEFYNYVITILPD
jgi:hypothetical protein